eukprot:3540232-Pleurochrysis_carterae.AAC.1
MQCNRLLPVDRAWQELARGERCRGRHRARATARTTASAERPDCADGRMDGRTERKAAAG